MAEMKMWAGWHVRHPIFLREKPKKLPDVVVEIKGIRANFEPHDLFPTRKEAVQQARGYLTKQRDQALRDLDDFSKPYTSPSGITYICPESKLEEWRAECRERLEIAERGLELCAAS